MFGWQGLRVLPDQKAMPQPVLKQFDLLANCTLRHVYFFGGVPEFAQPNNRFESAQGALR